MSLLGICSKYPNMFDINSDVFGVFVAEYSQTQGAEFL